MGNLGEMLGNHTETPKEPAGGFGETAQPADLKASSRENKNPFRQARLGQNTNVSG